MKKILKTVWDDDIGNDLMDWLVLATGIIMLGFAFIAIIDNNNETLATDYKNIPKFTQAGA